MPADITNIHEAEFPEQPTPRGGTMKHLELSGERIGVHIEEIGPGDTTSYHHYHTAEEEHVIVLEGHATLHLGVDELPLKPGDHVWFPADKQEAHHIENTSDQPLKYLVFGERTSHDVVVYPEGQVMMVKAMDFQLFTYRPFKLEPENDR